VIDRLQKEAYHGGPLTGVNGLWLLEQVGDAAVYRPQLQRGFVQELHIARDLGLLTFKVRPDPRPNLADTDPNWYLQTLSDFALTVAGQDRARRRVVVQPLPDPSKDDGRKISDLIFRHWHAPALSGLLPTLPGTARVRLPSASTTCCDRSKVAVSHPHTKQQRLTAHLLTWLLACSCAGVVVVRAGHRPITVSGSRSQLIALLHSTAVRLQVGSAITCVQSVWVACARRPACLGLARGDLVRVATKRTTQAI
jgi:hypothetical protein